MAKFYGVIGFVTSVEDTTNPGVWIEKVTEKNYYGDILKNSRRWQNGNNTTNDSIEISNSISIIADSFACDNLSTIRYANWMGVNWKVSNIDIQLPRLVLQLGGIYNG